MTDKQEGIVSEWIGAAYDKSMTFLNTCMNATQTHLAELAEDRAKRQEERQTRLDGIHALRELVDGYKSLGQTIGVSLQYSDQIRNVLNNFTLSAPQLQNVEKRILKEAFEAGQDKEDALAVYRTLKEKGFSDEEAISSLKAVAEVQIVTGQSAEELANKAAELKVAYGRVPENLKQTLAIISSFEKLGMLTAEQVNSARYEVSESFNRLGMAGDKANAMLLSTLKTGLDGGMNEGQVTDAINELSRHFFNEDFVNNLKKEFSIDIKGIFSKNRENPLGELVDKILKESGGDEQVLQNMLLSNKELADFFRVLSASSNQYEQNKAEILSFGQDFDKNLQRRRVDNSQQLREGDNRKDIDIYLQNQGIYQGMLNPKNILDLHQRHMMTMAGALPGHYPQTALHLGAYGNTSVAPGPRSGRPEDVALWATAEIQKQIQAFEQRKQEFDKNVTKNNPLGAAIQKAPVTPQKPEAQTKPVTPVQNSASIKNSKEVLGGAEKEIANLASKTQKALTDLSKEIATKTQAIFVQAGVQLALGLANGMFFGIPFVRQAALTLGNVTKSAFANSVQIKSPSRVFMGYGKNIGQGISIGVDQEKGNLGKKMAQLGSAAEKTMSDLGIGNQVGGTGGSKFMPTSESAAAMAGIDTARKAGGSGALGGGYHQGDVHIHVNVQGSGNMADDAQKVARIVEQHFSRFYKNMMHENARKAY